VKSSAKKFIKLIPYFLIRKKMVLKKLSAIVIGLFVISFVSAWSVDMTNPVNDTYDSKINEFSWSISGINISNVDSCWYTLDNGVTNVTISNCDDGLISTFIDSSEDSNVWQVYANDTSGNIEGDSVSFWVDSIAPVISWIIPATNPIAWASDTINLQISYTETNPKQIEFGIYDSSNNEEYYLRDSILPFVTSTSKGSLTDDEYLCSVTITDIIGHSTIINTTVYIDNVPPVASIDNPANASLHKGDVSIETSATDDRSGVDEIEIEVDGSSEAICSDDECDYAWDSTAAADGWHEINATATDNAGNAHTDTIVIEIDNTAPVITLLGSNPQIIEVFDAYAEAGATALDARDGNVTDDIITDASAVDTDVLGDYIVTYTVSDEAGTVAVENRTVSVVDTTAPVITLVGDNPQEVEFNTSYASQEQGATASDNYDNDSDVTASIVIDSSAVNVNTLGTYIVRYDVQDSSGNPAVQVTRNVTVVDKTDPVITLVGDNPQIIEVGDAYVEQGATASDNYDGNMTANISIDNSAVDTNTVGSYDVLYEVQDSFGNSANATRTVNVVDTTSPVITILGSNPETIERMDNYVDAGATASDTYDGDLTANITNTSNVNENVAGFYTVEYYVEDSSGNNATETRNVTVQDTVTPSIEVFEPIQNKTYTTSSIPLKVGSDESINWKYSLNGGASNASFAPNTTISLSNGDYTLTVYVSDTAGNENSTNVSFSVDKPAAKSSSGGGRRSSSCVKVWNCSVWNKWSVCTDENIQYRSCLEMTKVGCGEGYEKDELESLMQSQSCSLKIVSGSGSDSDSVEGVEIEDSDTDSTGTGITGGVIGFAKSGTGMLTIATLVAVLTALGIIHTKRKQLIKGSK